MVEPELRERVRDAGLQLVNTIFSRTASANAFDTLFAELLEKRPARGQR
jgi:hypothetical protein